MCNKTKIIATFGPALKDKKILEKALDKVNVLRFNFSHLTPEQAKKELNLVNDVLKSKKRKVALLADLKGPEVRTDDQEYEIKNNCIYKLVYGKGDPLSNKLGMDYPELYKKIKVRNIIKVDDGGGEFQVVKIDGQQIFIKAKNTFFLGKRKSINFVKIDLGLPIIGKRDEVSLKFIAKENFSWVAASFVRSKKDVLEVKKFLKKAGNEIPLISKIENHQAIKNIEEIIEVSEGVMVARGDLGVEYSYAEVPFFQKMIIKKSQKKGKIIIVATQMLDSMIRSSYPSRPEANDVFSAVMSRVDAVMLSGETANGLYPLEAIEVMHNIVKKTERNMHWLRDARVLLANDQKHPIIPFLKQGIRLSFSINSKCTLILSQLGKSVTFMSAFKANHLNVVATHNKKLFYKMHLHYSIYPLLLKKSSLKKNNQEEILEEATKILKVDKIIKNKDSIVFLYSFIYKNKYHGLNSIREIRVE